MDFTKKMILIKGEPNDEIIRSFYDPKTKMQVVGFRNGKEYRYGYLNVIWVDVKKEIDTEKYMFQTLKGEPILNIKACYVFEHCNRIFYRFQFSKTSFQTVRKEEVKLVRNVSSMKEIKQKLDYYQQVAAVVGLESDQGQNILQEQCKKITTLTEDIVLSKYLLKQSIEESNAQTSLLFPFGSNLSQIQAVEKALKYNMSVIEGPPGTGKTQTILNIVANILYQGSSVAIVSNNNSATDNVYEKLEKYGIQYTAAQLGNQKNKELFLKVGQQVNWNHKVEKLSEEEVTELEQFIKTRTDELILMYESKNKIAVLKQELSSLQLEQQYFEDYFNENYETKNIFRRKTPITSKRLLSLWVKLQTSLAEERSIGWFTKLQSLFVYQIKDIKALGENPESFIPHLKYAFYNSRTNEILNEIKQLEKQIGNYKFDQKAKELTEDSWKLLHHKLFLKYHDDVFKTAFTKDDLWKRPETVLSRFPIILSTTHAIKSSLKDVVYDYLVVDEASQVDLVTGVLGMSVAKNIVVVGDLMQLPNVIKEEDRNKISEISNRLKISNAYRYEAHSLLSSICQLFPNVPKTLLKEHYRCHPKIIDFCNQKFYDNQLIIMTKDHGETDVLNVRITAAGNHARGRVNERQIEEVKQIVTSLNSESVGVISPYRDQSNRIEMVIPGIDISTVHKFQGREKDDIIISTVDNQIGEFTDQANLLNVAVSRAKNRLHLVISDHEKNEQTNIGDLVKYIQYHNFSVVKSDIHSVFDLLYKGFEKERKAYLSKAKKISEYDSENIMYVLLQDILSMPEFSKYDVVAHVPLNTILADLSKLTSDEDTRFVMNEATHVDFLLFHRMDKKPVLIIEVDGYHFHQENSEQRQRDERKDRILGMYELPYLRLNTTGSQEREKIITKLLS